MKNKDLKGVIVAIATPFDEEGRLDVDGLRRLTQYVLDGRVHGIMTTGETGEFPSLLREEKRAGTKKLEKTIKC